ncbi:MAG: branched-chain amino acid transport system ATP-binding protein [Chloroflexota bacterium]|nr:branched-chain amino acid transport system ATP-binding protein [Chloroflexota bacterium]
MRFGGIVAVQDASFGIDRGEIVGLIGPNGAGKTTLFNVITRFYRPTSGDVKFDGNSLLQASPHEVIGLGISRTFQNVELFRTMTVLDNVLVGDHVNVRAPWLASSVRLPFVRQAEERSRVAAMEALDHVGLAALARRPVAGLPFGSLKRVELARALVSKPRLLLLDEPAGGLNHTEVGALGELIRAIHDDYKVTVLLVEHHMNLVMGISDRVVVLNFGKRIAIGTPAQVRADPAVIEAYLGAESGAA